MVDRPLRIAMIAPPWFQMPPDAYGGIEQLVAHLVRTMIGRGNEVTLIGAGNGGNGMDATVLNTFDAPQADRIGESLPEALHAALAMRLLDGLDFDVVHDHCLTGPLTAAARDARTVVTVHGPVTGELGDLYAALGDTIDLVAISDTQRAFRPDLNWVATVHNAIDVASFPHRGDKQDYVLFLGRMSHDKGVHVAVDAAREAWPTAGHRGQVRRGAGAGLLRRVRASPRPRIVGPKDHLHRQIGQMVHPRGKPPR